MKAMTVSSSENRTELGQAGPDLSETRAQIECKSNPRFLKNPDILLKRIFKYL